MSYFIYPDEPFFHSTGISSYRRIGMEFYAVGMIGDFQAADINIGRTGEINMFHSRWLPQSTGGFEQPEFHPLPGIRVGLPAAIIIVSPSWIFQSSNIISNLRGSIHRMVAAGGTMRIRSFEVQIILAIFNGVVGFFTGRNTLTTAESGVRPKQLCNIRMHRDTFHFSF
jgi:hypothetical protein